MGQLAAQSLIGWCSCFLIAWALKVGMLEVGRDRIVEAGRGILFVPQVTFATGWVRNETGERKKETMRKSTF